MNTPEQIAYRVGALVSSGASVIGLALLDTSDGGSAITTAEVIMALVVTVTSWAAHASVQALPEPRPGWFGTAEAHASARAV